ncbi:hypothetical protein ACJX0J_034825 [Zea mays]
MRWTEAGYTTVAHEKINQDEVQEDIEINEGDIDAPLDDEGQAKDVILDDSERGLGFGYESIHVWHKEKRKLGKNLMIHLASDSGSIQFSTLDVQKITGQRFPCVDALQQMKEDITNQASHAISILL